MQSYCVEFTESAPEYEKSFDIRFQLKPYDASFLSFILFHPFIPGAAGEALPVNSERDVFDIIDMEYRPPNERDV